ncbi:hypothetical protein NXA67_003192 [Vibrio cholerae]|nr:hypothetical protein [Vibrio cholerae]
MTQSVTQFEAILNSQGQAIEAMMTRQATANPKLMQEAKERLEEAICMAIQASKETKDEIN